MPENNGVLNVRFDERVLTLCAASLTCHACQGRDLEHSVSCPAVGRFGCKHFLAPTPRTIVKFRIEEDDVLQPTALCTRKRMVEKGTFPAKRLSSLDCTCDALRGAKEPGPYVGVVAHGVGWPCLWLEQHVLIYGPRPDGKCQVDDLSEDNPVYYVTQHGRKEAGEYVRNSGME